MNGTARGLLQRMDDSGIPLLLTRLVLGGLFIYMGAVKIADPVAFLKQLREYHVYPEEPAILLNATAVVLPWLEAACGVALLAGVMRRGAATIALLMLLLFTPAVLTRALAIFHTGEIPFCDIKFDCGCGSGVVFICRKLAENIGLMLLAALAIVSRSRRFCLAPSWGRPVASDQRST